MKNIFIHSYYGEDGGIDGLYEVSFADDYDFKHPNVEELFKSSFEELEEKIENDFDEDRVLVRDLGELLDYLKEHKIILGYKVHPILKFDCDYGVLSGAYEAGLY